MPADDDVTLWPDRTEDSALVSALLSGVPTSSSSGVGAHMQGNLATTALVLHGPSKKTNLRGRRKTEPVPSRGLKLGKDHRVPGVLGSAGLRQDDGLAIPVEDRLAMANTRSSMIEEICEKYGQGTNQLAVPPDT